MKFLAIALSLTLTACSSAPKAPDVIPQTVNNSTVTNYGENPSVCRSRGDFTYCRTCYQYDGQLRPTCYWSRAQ